MPESHADVREAHDAERFWRIIEAAPDGFVMVDTTGTIVLVNAQTEHLFGYERAKLVGQPVEMLLPASARLNHVVERDRYIAHPHTRAMGIGLDLVGLHQGGHEFPVEVSLSPLDDEYIIAVVRDVRARRDAETLLRSAEEHVRLLEDRDRIARDLHDHVIQRLFAAGMALEGAVARSDDADVNTRVARVVDDLDDTIRQLRSVIFDLQDRGRDRSAGLRSELLAVVADARPTLGYEPRVRFDGPIDTMGGAVAEHVLAVLREALTNVGRHAHASAVDVHVVATADQFVLDVTDNGVGPAETPGAGNGLRNLERRAAELGGTFAFGPGPDGGSEVHWQIPLDH